MRTFRQQQGRASEHLACAYLRAQGYRIEATNVRFPVGELDIVAWEGKTLCFVEVRSRATDQFGSALESVTEVKRRRLIRAAQWHLTRLRRAPEVMRFDLVAIEGATEGRPPRVELVRGAFEAENRW